MQFLYIQNRPVILGIEGDQYYHRTYDCEPPICFGERVTLWRSLLPPGSIIFPVPEFTLSYDVLSQRVGVYKNPKIFHLIQGNCTKEERKSVKKRTYKGNYLTFLPIENA